MSFLLLITYLLLAVGHCSIQILHDAVLYIVHLDTTFLPAGNCLYLEIIAKIERQEIGKGGEIYFFCTAGWLGGSGVTALMV